MTLLFILHYSFLTILPTQFFFNAICENIDPVVRAIFHVKSKYTMFLTEISTHSIHFHNLKSKYKFSTIVKG